MVGQVALGRPTVDQDICSLQHPHVPVLVFSEVVSVVHFELVFDWSSSHMGIVVAVGILRHSHPFLSQHTFLLHAGSILESNSIPRSATPRMVMPAGQKEARSKVHNPVASRVPHTLIHWHSGGVFCV